MHTHRHDTEVLLRAILQSGGTVPIKSLGEAADGAHASDSPTSLQELCASTVTLDAIATTHFGTWGTGDTAPRKKLMAHTLALLRGMDGPTPAEADQWTAWIQLPQLCADDTAVKHCSSDPVVASGVSVRAPYERGQRVAPVDVSRKRFLSLRSPAALQCPFCDKPGYNLIVCGQAAVYPGLNDVCVITHKRGRRRGGVRGVAQPSGACVPSLDAFSPKAFPASDRNLLASVQDKPHRDFLGALSSPKRTMALFTVLAAAALHGKPCRR